VPEKNEVPTLIDDVSNRAKIRGITIGRIQPLGVEAGQPFDTHRYRLEVYGHFDQVGEFLSDVASLPRIIVPEDLTLRPAQANTQRLLADTSGALLEASFSIRTFVKTPSPPPAPGASR
jgi:Tfp pilus assembly protein PilO